MKIVVRVVRVVALSAALSLAGAASAQQAQPRTRIGIGVGLPTGGELSTIFAQAAAGASGVFPPQLYVPIDLSPTFRLEPELGFVAASQDGGGSASYYTLGAGAFYVMPLAPQAHLYAGGRLLVGWERSEDDVGAKTKGTDLYLAGAFGGEIFPNPRLGIGAEAQLGRWSIGERNTTTAGVTTTSSPGGSSWQTQGVIFFRVYFT